jgi:hypothetical protein
VTDLNRPLLGEPNAPCRTCGSPLAADQRYCLQCGTRRAEARLPFLDILAQQAPQSAAAGAAAQTTTTTTSHGPRGFFGRMSTNAAAVAGVACLVLALGVGVLIGGTGSDAAPAGSPQVITVGGAAPAVVPTATPAAPGATETTPDATTTKPKGKSKSTSKDTSSSSSGSKATNSAVKNLDKTSGSDYSKKSAKLPKEVGTGGKAPPKDTSGTKIGGGSGVESIG